MPLPKSLRLALVLFATCCLALAVCAIAKDEKPAAADEKKSTSADPAADFEAFMKANQPGEHHAHLKQFVGTFDVDMEVVMAPGAPPQKTKGRQKSELVFDGRYLH